MKKSSLKQLIKEVLDSNSVEQKIQDYISKGGKGNLNLSNTSITSLPDNLTKVGGYLDLAGTKITSLPDNLTVGNWLDLENTPITSLPKNLKGVESYLYLVNTPLSKQYTKEEIRKMVPGIKGDIYV